MVGQSKGIFGGTFDPVHNGHLAIAAEAAASLKLNEVLFVPARRSPHKITEPVAPMADRVEMLRLALQDKPHYQLSTAEAGEEGPSFTVRTLSMLKDDNSGDELYFIMGWDSLAGFPRWKEPLRIIRLCRIAAVPRPGYPPPDLDSLESRVPGLKERVIILQRPLIDISSSEIRKRLAQGLSIHGLVPEAVESYIKRHGLYLKSG